MVPAGIAPAGSDCPQEYVLLKPSPDAKTEAGRILCPPLNQEGEMSKAASLIVLSTFAVACSSQAPPTAPLEVPVFSQSAQSANANGGNFGSPLSGDEEVPVRPTQARGSAIFQLNDAGTELSYKLIVANIDNAFMAHIHQAPAGSNGPIVVWLFPSTTPGVTLPPAGGRLDGVIAEGTITADDLTGALAGQPLDALVAILKNGTGYVNVHTSDGVDPANTGPGDFPGGEIRGQVEHRGH